MEVEEVVVTVVMVMMEGAMAGGGQRSRRLPSLSMRNVMDGRRGWTSAHNSSRLPRAGRWLRSKNVCVGASGLPETSRAASHAAWGPGPSRGVMPVQWNQCAEERSSDHRNVSAPTILQKALWWR